MGWWLLSWILHIAFPAPWKALLDSTGKACRCRKKRNREAGRKKKKECFASSSLLFTAEINPVSTAVHTFVIEPFAVHFFWDSTFTLFETSTLFTSFGQKRRKREGKAIIKKEGRNKNNWKSKTAGLRLRLFPPGFRHSERHVNMFKEVRFPKYLILRGCLGCR